MTAYHKVFKKMHIMLIKTVYLLNRILFSEVYCGNQICNHHHLSRKINSLHHRSLI